MVKSLVAALSTLALLAGSGSAFAARKPVSTLTGKGGMSYELKTYAKRDGSLVGHLTAKGTDFASAPTIETWVAAQVFGAGGQETRLAPNATTAQLAVGKTKKALKEAAEGIDTYKARINFGHPGFEGAVVTGAVAASYELGPAGPDGKRPVIKEAQAYKNDAILFKVTK